jgi:hypothetical protein
MGRKNGPWTVESSERLYADEFAEVWVDEVSKPGAELAARDDEDEAGRGRARR